MFSVEKSVSKEYARKKYGEESSHDWLSEGDLGSLDGLQHILCDAVGEMYSARFDMEYVFTYICYFYSSSRLYQASICEFDLNSIYVSD